MSELLDMQAPQGLPRSPLFDLVSDPMLPPVRSRDLLAHFPEEVYDKRPESHLSRLMSILLGETGTGQLRKRYVYAHLSQYLATAHYNDLDQFFAGVFGLKRLIRERIDVDAYDVALTDDEWEAINAADASYRARLEAFTASLSMAGTPSGLAIAASAVLGAECRIYEAYEFLDAGGLPPFATRSVMPSGGATNTGAGRNEFIVRPMREITAEERAHLIRVLTRLKPADTLLTIDTEFSDDHDMVPASRAEASSTYWRVQRHVLAEQRYFDQYLRADEGVSVEQPTLAFSQYQGEAWNYNTDVASVTSYAEDRDGTRISEVNYTRHVNERGFESDLLPTYAIQHPADLMRGRLGSDGVLSGPVATRGQA